MQTNSNYPMHRQPSVVQQKPKSRLRWLPLVLLVIIGIVGAGRTVLPGSHAQTASAALTATKPPIDQAALSSAVNQVIAGTSMQVGVSITDLTMHKTYDYGLHDTPFVAASTAKLLSASLFLHQVEQHKTSFKEDVGDASAATELKKMIVNSDNDAWAAFNTQLGHPALLTYAQSLGMTNYDPDLNTITTDDLAILLSKLRDGTLLDNTHTELLLSYMHQANETQFIASAVPSNVSFYHKAGYLEDRAMDAAIIDNGKRPYAIVIFTKDNSGAYDFATGQKIFADITKASLSSFAL